MFPVNNILRSIVRKDNETAKSLIANSDEQSSFSDSKNYLLWSVQANNKYMVQYLLNEGYDANYMDSFGESPLFLAVDLNLKEIVEVLLLSGADVDGLKRCSALKLVLSSQHISDDIVQLILKNLFEKCGSKEAVEKLMGYHCRLDQAAFLEDPWVIYNLWKRDIPINACHRINKRTAVHVSTMLDDVSTLKLLVQCKANMQALDHEDATALHYIYKDNMVHNSKKLEMLEILLNIGLVPTSCTKRGVFQVSHTLVNGDSSAVQVLLQSAIDFTATDLLSKKTVLHYLATNTNSDFSGVLRPYVKKFHVNAVDMYNTTPLYYACKAGNVQFLKFLLSEHAEVECTHSVYNFTPLHQVYTESKSDFEDEYIECAKLLLQHRANPQFVVNQGAQQVTIFDAAQGKNKFKPIIAQIALLENLGTKISDIVRSKINSQHSFKKYLKRCNQMLTKRIAGSITVLQVLQSDKRKMVHYVNREKSLKKLKNIQCRRKLKKHFSYYYCCVKNQLSRAIKFLKRRITLYTAICRLSEGKLSLSYHIIIDNILECLDDKDLDHLYELGLNGVYLP